jgi:hypothetical protein
MLSMFPKSKNKNKSRMRGKDGEEVDPRSRKIVFASPPPPPIQHISDHAEEQRAWVQRPVLIPPSSLPPDLVPNNVFITSVDVEEGMKKGKKKKQRVVEEELWGFEEAEVVLDYGGGEENTEMPAPPQAKLGLDPSMFDSAPSITSRLQLSKGGIVGFTVRLACCSHFHLLTCM